MNGCRNTSLTAPVLHSARPLNAVQLAWLVYIVGALIGGQLFGYVATATTKD